MQLCNEVLKLEIPPGARAQAYNLLGMSVLDDRKAMESFAKAHDEIGKFENVYGETDFTLRMRRTTYNNVITINAICSRLATKRLNSISKNEDESEGSVC